MFANKISILYVQRRKVQLFDITVGAETDIALIEAADVSDATIVDAITKILTKFSRKSLRVLMAGEVSLVSHMKVNKDLLKADSREELYSMVQQQIPESFSQDQWDVMQLQSEDAADSEVVQIAVFVPVLTVFERLVQALAAGGVTAPIPVVAQDTLSADTEEALRALAAQSHFDGASKRVLRVMISAKQLDAQQQISDASQSAVIPDQKNTNADNSDQAGQPTKQAAKSDTDGDRPLFVRSKFLLILAVLSMLVFIASAAITVIIHIQ